MFGRGQEQGSESLGYCHELQMAFLWHHRGPISRTDPHNFRKVEQEEVNRGPFLIYRSYWLASETLLLENIGSANLPMFSIWDYFIKTPKGLWRNNKSLLWMDYSAHNIEERNSFDPASFLFHILSLVAECDGESRWCSGVGAQPQIIQLKGGSNLIVHANRKTGQSSCSGVSWEAAASCPPPTATLFFILRDSSALLLPLLKGAWPLSHQQLLHLATLEGWQLKSYGCLPFISLYYMGIWMYVTVFVRGNICAYVYICAHTRIYINTYSAHYLQRRGV